MINMIFDNEKIEKKLNQLLTKILVKKINKAFPENNYELETSINNLDFNVGLDKTKIHFEGDIDVSSALFMKLIFSKF